MTIIHQFDHFQAEAATAKEAVENPKIKVLWSHEPRGFLGGGNVEKLRVENLKTHETQELATDGVFIFVGMVPRTELLKDVVPLDKWGCVETDDSMATSVPGLYAAGDIRAKKFRQITTAVADGTVAALAVQKFLRENRA